MNASAASDDATAEATEPVEVVYALPGHQEIVCLEWRSGMTIKEAVEASGLVDRFPDIEVREGRIGVYGFRQPLDFELSPGDRVELYRPLEMSPTEARRLRAAREKSDS